jgi:parallel beta-helix repeat protein
MSDWWDHVTAATSPADGNVDIHDAPATIDGISMVTGFTVLLKHQATSSENRAYVYNQGAPNFLTPITVDYPVPRSTVRVDKGTVNAKTEWSLVDTTNYIWAMQSPFFNVRDFGAKGDGSHDDTAAIQAAINAARPMGGAVLLPPGSYGISTPLLLDAGGFTIVGAGFQSSTIGVLNGANMNAVFQFSDTAPNSFNVFKDFSINGQSVDGNSAAAFGIVSATISHSRFENLKIQGTSTAAISIGYGWDNDILGCEISYNNGDGILLTNSSNNAVNVVRCKVFANTGIGLQIAGGTNVNIEGNTFEANAKCAIYAQLAVQGMRIVGNYFESNSATGWEFAKPAAKTIHSPVIINGSADPRTMGATYPCGGIEISGNYFTGCSTTNTQSGCVYLIGANGISVVSNDCGKDVSNDCSTGSALTLLGASFRQTAVRVSALRVESNSTNFAALFNAEDLVEKGENPRGDWLFGTAARRNYFSADFFSNSRLNDDNVIGVPTVIGKSSEKHGGYDAFDFPAPPGGTDIWGQVIDLTVYPELANALCTLSRHGYTLGTRRVM